MALGVMSVVVVLLIYGVVSQSFTSNDSLGYNQIVAARGDKLQITLNSVYYLSAPVDNVSYADFLEFQPPDVRQREWRNSLTFAADQALRDGLADAIALDPLSTGPLDTQALLADVNTVADLHRPWNEAGKYHSAASMVFDPALDEYVMSGPATQSVPILLGDYYASYRRDWHDVPVFRTAQAWQSSRAVRLLPGA